MIITRTPLRIAIGGGGTDLPSYYSKFGGFFISAAIDKYVYLGMQETFTNELILKYSEMERAKSVDDIKHDIARAALKSYGYDVARGLEMASFADIPAGTGLGSSGSFTVGFLKGLHALDQKTISADALAESASHLVMNILQRPDGLQDQYAASRGGINCYTVNTVGKVTVEPLRVSQATLDTLRDHLALFFTGFYRQSESNLRVQKEQSEARDQSMLEGLHKIKEIGFNIKDALEKGSPEAFGFLMKEHWESKKKRQGEMTNSLIDQWYERALANSAVGGKVIGAGGGGFLLFYASDRERLIKALTAAGLRHVRFNFDFEGSKILA